VLNGDSGTVVPTGLTFQQELTLFDDIFGKLKQPIEYQATNGPNSNTYAKQMLTLASRQGKFKMPPKPKGARGWFYSGEHRYSGPEYDELGNPKAPKAPETPPLPEGSRCIDKVLELGGERRYYKTPDGRIIIQSIGRDGTTKWRYLK
jgi:hypothetical protein